MLKLFCFFVFLNGAFAATCNIKDPRTNQMSECRGDYCTLTKLMTLPAKENENPVIVQGCLNGTGIGEDDLGCFVSITDMDARQYCKPRKVSNRKIFAYKVTIFITRIHYKKS